MQEPCSEEYYQVKKKLKSLGLSHEMMQTILPFLRRTSPMDDVHKELAHQIYVLKDKIESEKDKESIAISTLQGKIRDLKEKNKTLRSGTKGQALVERDEAVKRAEESSNRMLAANARALKLNTANEALKEKCEGLNKRKNKWLEAQGQELGEKHEKEILALKEKYEKEILALRAGHRKQLISILEEQLPDGMGEILHQLVTE
tara:strand:- start:11375 stop:11983 length:609 start_codon:yes stop_codon:yes gene_type:complete